MPGPAGRRDLGRQGYSRLRPLCRPRRGEGLHDQWGGVGAPPTLPEWLPPEASVCLDLSLKSEKISVQVQGEWRLATQKPRERPGKVWGYLGFWFVPICFWHQQHIGIGSNTG